MNYHSDSWIMGKVQEHWEELLSLYPNTNQIVGIFYQGAVLHG